MLCTKEKEVKIAVNGYTIEITHRARSRMGFALGAVKAAEWVGGKKGYFSIDDMINAILQ